jgi:hypothetical protein
MVAELSVRNYTFNSISAFNISINLIYGQLKVTVIDPNENVLVS